MTFNEWLPKVSELCHREFSPESTSLLRAYATGMTPEQFSSNFCGNSTRAPNIRAGLAVAVDCGSIRLQMGDTITYTIGDTITVE